MDGTLAALAAIAALVFAYALISERLAESWVTAPIVFTAAGMALGGSGLGLIEQRDLGVGAIGVLAEFTLVALLFTDAIRIDLRRLRRSAELPARLLGVGLPLTLGFGSVLAWLIFGDLGWAGAFAVAAVLTPTDAALGKSVVVNPDVPVRIRQTINVESGLNDGLMAPIVTIAVAAVATAEALGPASEWVGFAVRQIGFGLMAGAAAGAGGGWLLDRAAARGWVEGAFRQLATLAVGVAAFAGAELAGGNGFVAAFVAGLAFGAVARDHCATAYHFAEDEGELFALLTFLAFGATVAGPAIRAASWQTLLYAALSLTVIRMVPVAAALAGTGLKLPTVAYLGWFGPRGLASILFGVLILEETAPGMPDAIFTVVVVTVLVSILAHGASAAPLSARYAAWFHRSGQPEMEAMPMASFPSRG